MLKYPLPVRREDEKSKENKGEKKPYPDTLRQFNKHWSQYYIINKCFPLSPITKCQILWKWWGNVHGNYEKSENCICDYTHELNTKYLFTCSYVNVRTHIHTHLTAISFKLADGV